MSKKITYIFIFLFTFYLFLPVTNAYMLNMKLNEKQSILLPNFDTTAIIGNSISEIGLNLYVVKFTNPNPSQPVHLTINPYNPKTNAIRDGLSAMYSPVEKDYLEIKLPLSLFENILGTNERLLLKIVGSEQELIFSSHETMGTDQDPYLTVIYTEGIQQPTNNAPVTINNVINIENIDNSQIHYGTGDNVAMNKNIIQNSGENKNIKSSFFDKFFWYFIVAIAVIVISAFINHKLGLINQLSNQNFQTHYGSGDNITGDKNINSEKKLPPDFKTENPIQIKLIYKPPKLTEDDQCDDKKCVGVYTRIGEDNDFVYLDHPSFKSSKVVGYNYDSGANGEKLISDWKVEEKRIYEAITIPKSSILNMAILSDSASTTKSIPNYKMIN